MRAELWIAASTGFFGLSNIFWPAYSGRLWVAASWISLALGLFTFGTYIRNYRRWRRDGSFLSKEEQHKAQWG